MGKIELSQTATEQTKLAFRIKQQITPGQQAPFYFAHFFL